MFTSLKSLSTSLIMRGLLAVAARHFGETKAA